MTDSQNRKFSRRQIVSSALGTVGLFGLAKLGRTANAADPDSSVVQDLFNLGDSEIPFIGLTEDGPLISARWHKLVE